MKQRITIKQLGELSTDQKNRLRSLVKLKKGDFVYVDDIDARAIGGPVILADIKSDTEYIYYIAEDWIHKSDHLINAYPLLSIGQMIEIIQEKKPLKSISKARFDKWIVNIETSTLGYKDELCDSLWETVMRIL